VRAARFSVEIVEIVEIVKIVEIAKIVVRAMPRPSQPPKQVFLVTRGDRRQTLLTFVARRLGIDETAARQRIESGAVYVDGRRQRRPEQRLEPGQRVRVYQVAQPGGALPEPRIAYQDRELAVLDKPAGLPSIATRVGGTDTVADFVRRQFGEAARLLHRLDREASGLLLVSLGVASRAVDPRRIERRYLAIVGAAPPQRSWEIRSRLSLHRGRARSTSGPRARPAQTLVETLRGPSSAGRYLLGVELRSGRTHQIRAHLAEQGLPLLGDRRYGGPAAPRLALHAHCLRLPEAAFELHSPLPEALRGLLI
jgi:23S rRNA-/tRNA-specific pseudouridylate synthase